MPGCRPPILLPDPTLVENDSSLRTDAAPPTGSRDATTPDFDVLSALLPA